ncbi:RHS repeat-associated core domain-containing protein [Pseudomonas sp. FP198]|uniref:RHS repeat-associated core domain-containing protein n=1 Tax=Pseudomonas sp. FP198 TaxID=2954084 RepID=UPI002733DB20|nr:RHS repeat-associated core domain-containing protein [Pseudomonas sp. FP198]WLG97182.1 RHS repeat-associated core domain-containing protein [Pseudomonas sp. FP198]
MGVRNGSDPEALRFYQGYQLSYTLQDDQLTQFLYDGDHALGQQGQSITDPSMLLLSDGANNVIGESRADGLHESCYSAYGERREDNGLRGLLAFAGEVREAATGWYLLGRGYRAYNPALMRFHSPDSLSPFGAGGVNPYSYCLGNPIAWRDPSGHRSQPASSRREPDPGYRDPIEQPEKPGASIAQWIGVGLAALFLAVSVVLMPWSAPATIGLTAAYVAGVVGIGVQAAGLGLQVYGTIKQDDTLSAIGGGLGAVGGLLAGGGIYMAKAAVAAAQAATRATTQATIAAATTGFANISKTAGSVARSGSGAAVSATGAGAGVGAGVRAGGWGGGGTATSRVRSTSGSFSASSQSSTRSQPRTPSVDYGSDSSMSSLPGSIGSTEAVRPPALPPAPPQSFFSNDGRWVRVGVGRWLERDTRPGLARV